MQGVSQAAEEAQAKGKRMSQTVQVAKLRESLEEYYKGMQFYLSQELLSIPFDFSNPTICSGK